MRTARQDKRGLEEALLELDRHNKELSAKVPREQVAALSAESSRVLRSISPDRRQPQEVCACVRHCWGTCSMHRAGGEIACSNVLFS